MKYISCSEMKDLEKSANDAGLLFSQMMENAGESACNSILNTTFIGNQTVAAIFCGKGNNGGDGFVLARKMAERGVKVSVILVEGPPVTTDAKTNFDLLNPEINIATSIPKHVDIVADAIYGTGFHGKLDDSGLKAVNEINKLKNTGAKIYAIDIPSGLSGDVTKDEDLSNYTAVNADYTITFHLPKKVHQNESARAFIGSLIVTDIGIGTALEPTYTTSLAGYKIPYKHNISYGNSKVCIIAHGFASSMESPTAKLIMSNFPKNNIGCIAFDFPSHGVSPADGDMLTLDNCINDLALIELKAKQLAPNAEICYFGSSFGAYITLLYLAKGNFSGKRAFLRSAAITMSELFSNPTPSERDSLNFKGYFLMAEEYGFEKPIKITKEFWSRLGDSNLTEIWKNRKISADKLEIAMVHGTDDEVIDYNAAAEFSKKYGIKLSTIENGDHRLSKDGMPETVLKLATEMFIK